MKVIRFWLVLGLCAWPAFAAAPRGCSGSVSLGTFRLWVRPSDKGMPLPIKSVAQVPVGAHLIWEPVRLFSDSTGDAEVSAVLLPEGDGELSVLAPQKAGRQAEWAVPKNPTVVALIYGPHGLSEGKVKELVTHNHDLLSQLANYAQQTSEVEALVQQLADSEDSGGGVDAALKGFSSRYGVDLSKLDTKASTDQQAVVLLKTVLPSANSYDPLAPRSAQMQQSVGLAASVAGLFFGNSVGLAAGGAALFQNLKTVFFPAAEFRSAFAQSAAGAGEMALCAKSSASKSRVRLAYLWAYRVPGDNLPSVAIDGAAHLPLGSKSALRLKLKDPANVKQLELAREWRLVPSSGGAGTPVPVAVAAAPNSIEIDLSKTKLAPGDYRLAAMWDWEQLQVAGTVHLHHYGDFSRVRFAAGARDRLVEGSGKVPFELAGTDFEFVEKAAIEKGEARTPNPPEVHFSLPRGKRSGDQETIRIDVDTAAAGPYRLLLTQSDGVTHEIPFTVLPPNPKLTNLPVRINIGEPSRPLELEGSGLDRIEAIATPAGTVAGKAAAQCWSGEIRLKPAASEGRVYALQLHIQGHEAPIEVPNALEIIPPRPKIAAVRASVPADLGIQLHDRELPDGATVGLSLRVENLRPGSGAPIVELGCASGEMRAPLKLSPGGAGSGMIFLSVDPGRVGYPGCELTASVTEDKLGRSDPHPLGRVVRLPRLDEFTLTNEKVGDSEYAGVLKGRNLDVVEKVGWDAHNGVPVDSIPTPVPGDPSEQTLRVALPWPAPAPHAQVYVWLRSEEQGRQTSVAY
jgi:hypothetical protein